MKTTMVDAIKAMQKVAKRYGQNSPQYTQERRYQIQQVLRGYK